MLLPNANTSVPPAIRRLDWWYIISIGGVVVAGVALLAFPGVRAHVLTLRGWGAILVPSALFVPQFVVTFLVSRRLRRIRRKVADADGRVCVFCLYDLRGLAESGDCPECSVPFDAKVDRRMWRNARMLPAELKEERESSRGEGNRGGGGN